MIMTMFILLTRPKEFVCVDFYTVLDYVHASLKKF